MLQQGSATHGLIQAKFTVTVVKQLRLRFLYKLTTDFVPMCDNNLCICFYHRLSLVLLPCSHYQLACL